MINHRIFYQPSLYSSSHGYPSFTIPLYLTFNETHIAIIAQIKDEDCLDLKPEFHLQKKIVEIVHWLKGNISFLFQRKISIDFVNQHINTILSELDMLGFVRYDLAICVYESSAHKIYYYANNYYDETGFAVLFCDKLSKSIVVSSESAAYTTSSERCLSFGEFYIPENNGQDKLLLVNKPLLNRFEPNNDNFIYPLEKLIAFDFNTEEIKKMQYAFFDELTCICIEI